MTPLFDVPKLLDLDKVVRSTINPRRRFNEGALNELASNIRRHGVLQPILCRPTKVGENEFFEIVVAAVDDRQGLINKFEGDAALAVFGAPLPSADPESDALATARVLAARLRGLPMVDFGIGVSAGPVFAGNIGAEHRYEYTVIGDAVNEAARLADRAKSTPQRALCSVAALLAAGATERVQWTECGSETLRGRLEPTRMAAPAG